MTIMSAISGTGAPALPAHVLKLSARQTIFEDGDASDHLFEIASGIVMTYKVLPDGSRQIFEILRPGQFLGFTQAHHHAHGAQTLSKCHLRRYAQQSFLASPANQAKLLHHLIGHRDAHYAHALLLGRKSAAERIAMFFAEFVGTSIGGEDVHVSLREMSDYLGLRPETVSRQVAHLCKTELISRSRWGTYRVCDRKGLHHFAQEQECKPVAPARKTNPSSGEQRIAP